MSAAPSRPYLGHGIGLRVPHYAQALEGDYPVDWVECITENFLGPGGRPRAVLEALHARMPVVFHGVAMGIGSPEPPHTRYLDELKRLFADFPPAWVSDHLCWTHLGGVHSHDLLPLPYTEESLRRVVAHTRLVQDALGRQIALENVSSYVGFRASSMSEWEFLGRVAEQADCMLLLDINNVIVSAKNHDFTPEDFVRGVPHERVLQFHLANHTDRGHYKFDSHQGPVPDEVWELYRFALQTLGPVSSLIEWDEEVPTLARLCEEQQKASRIAQEVAAQETRP